MLSQLAFQSSPGWQRPHRWLSATWLILCAGHLFPIHPPRIQRNESHTWNEYYQSVASHLEKKKNLIHNKINL